MRSEAELPLPACQAGAPGPYPEPAAQIGAPMIPGAIPEEAVAALFGITMKTLREKRRKGEGPAYIRLSRSTTIYLAADLQAYLASRRVGVDVGQQEG